MRHRVTSFYSGCAEDCPLALYILLLVGESLNRVTKHVMARNLLQRIRMPEDRGELSINLYANDTSFILYGTKSNFTKLVLLLAHFGIALDLYTRVNKKEEHVTSLFALLLTSFFEL